MHSKYMEQKRGAGPALPHPHVNSYTMNSTICQGSQRLMEPGRGRVSENAFQRDLRSVKIDALRWMLSARAMVVYL